MIITMIKIVTSVVDIFMIFAASRLLQSAELFENGLAAFTVEVFNGYVKIKEYKTDQHLLSNFVLNFSKISERKDSL